MKKLPAALGALFLVVLPPLQAQTIVSNFDDVQFWTGSGPNRSVLVLEFSDNNNSVPTSVAWGYRWSGSTTMASMVFALTGSITGSGVPSPLAGADPRLAIDTTYFASFDAYFVNSITYNQIGLPAPWSQTVRAIEDNYFVDTTYPTIFTLAGNGVWNGAPFAQAQVGMSGLSLANGGWYGFAQTDGFDEFYTFAQPASAVPEPSVAGLCGVALLVSFVLRHHRRFA